jgi:hypothetical protein
MIAFSSLLFSCSHPDAVAGNTSSTTNEVSMQIVGLDGLPAAGARVLAHRNHGYLARSASLNDSVIRGLADNSGTVTLMLEPQTYDFYAQKDSMAMLWSQRVAEHQAIIQQLSPAQAVESAFLMLSGDSNSNEFFLNGWTLASLSTGSAVWLPSGGYALSHTQDGSLLTANWNLIWGSNSVPPEWNTNYLLLDDFADSTRPSSFPWLGFGSWYVTKSGETQFTGGYAKGFRIENSAITMDYALNGNGAYAILGFSFLQGLDRFSADFSGLDSLCVTSSDTGNLLLKLENIDAKTGAKATIDLTGIGRQCFYRSSFDSLQNLATVNNISFVRQAGSSLSFESVEIWGLAGDAWQ